MYADCAMKETHLGGPVWDGGGFWRVGGVPEEEARARQHFFVGGYTYTAHCTARLHTNATHLYTCIIYA